MVELDKRIAQVLEAYRKAVHAQDAAALIRLYDAKARVFDAWGIWSYEGADAWQRAVEGWLGSLGSERVVVAFDDVKTTGDGDFTLFSAIVRYSSMSAQGETVRTMQNRLTWGLRLKGHVLRIVHEHTSAPIGFDDMKAILQRPADGHAG